MSATDEGAAKGNTSASWSPFLPEAAEAACAEVPKDEEDAMAAMGPCADPRPWITISRSRVARDPGGAAAEARLEHPAAAQGPAHGPLEAGLAEELSQYLHLAEDHVPYPGEGMLRLWSDKLR